MMQIDFEQLYCEYACCRLTDAVIDPLVKELNAVNKTIEHYEKLWKGDNFKLLITVSADKKRDLVEIKKRGVSSKNRTVCFSIYIPYKTFPQFIDEISHVLDSTAEGISMVLRKYKVDPSGIPEAVGKVKKLIIESDNPERFKENTNPWKNIKTRVVNIDSDKILFQQAPGIISYIAEDVDDELIQNIIENADIDRIQISDYIPVPVLCRLDKVFIKRPEISFRVFGGYHENFNGWNLDFLRYMPSLQKLILDCFHNKESDLSILTAMNNLRGLSLEIYDLKDYSFVKSLPEHLEDLDIYANVKSGRVKFDCRCLLRFRNLQTLSLGKIDTNLECIAALQHLKALRLRAIQMSDLSFLKHMPIEDLSIMWCKGSKIDLSTLSGFDTLRRLELFSISKLNDISFISTLTGLEKLELIWLSNITRLPDLSSLNHLAEVRIDTLNKLADITGLLKVKNLKILKMGNVKSMAKESVYGVLDNQSIEAMQCFGGKSETNNILINRENKNEVFG